MTGFIKKLVLFLILFLSGLLLVITMLVILNKNLFKKYSPQQITTIFIGDSHMEMGLNDKLIPGSINLAKSSDGYIHSYAKLKALLELKNKINTVVLSFSAHNLSGYFNTFIDGRDAHFGFSDYFPILANDEKYELLKRNKLLGIHSVSFVLKKGFNNLFADSSRYSFLGGFAPQPWPLADYSHIDKRIKVQFYSEKSLLPFSDIQFKYLEKIIQLCNQYKVRLILMEMPLHEHYRDLVPAKYDSAMEAIIKGKPISFMHCRQLKLPDALYLPDGDHVNTPGADTATKYIRTLPGISN